MRLWPIFQRLCWKECRQGWLTLAFGLLLPPLAVDLQRNMNPYILGMSLNLPAISIFTLLLGVTVWAVKLGSEAHARQSYAGVHFPQHPALASYLTFMWQGSAAALIGLWIGYAQADRVEPKYFCYYLLYTMLLFASTFAVSFITASALTPWSGIVMGLVWALGNLQMFLVLTPNFYYDSETRLATQTMSGVVLMAFLAMMVLQSRTTMRLGLKAPRVLAPVLLGVVMISVPLCWFGEKMRLELHLGRPTPINAPVKLSSADGALAIEWHALSKDSVELRVIDSRRQHTLIRHFAQDIQPIWFVGNNAVILRQQRKKEGHLTLLRWALDTNSVETLASIPDNPEQWDSDIWDASMSRDGHYGLLLVPSPYGNYLTPCIDLWKIDMRLRTVTLLQPAWNWGAPNSWRGNDALFTFYRDVRSLSMTSGQLTPLPLPAPREGKE